MTLAELLRFHDEQWAKILASLPLPPGPNEEAERLVSFAKDAAGCKDDDRVAKFGTLARRAKEATSKGEYADMCSEIRALVEELRAEAE